MRYRIQLLMCAVLIACAGAVMLAHEITFKGTVTSVAPGTVTTVTVNVVDAKTKKTQSMTFEIDDETKVFRGTKAVKPADAHIDKGESIAITVNVDDSETMANIVKLSVKK